MPENIEINNTVDKYNNTEKDQELVGTHWSG